MSGARTYLDWNATAPLRPEARAAMVAALDVVGNPSSPHAEGRRARAIMEDAREQVAALVGAKPGEVVFTSGGTEGNNAVLAAGWDTVLVAGVEHDSVLAPARNSRARRIELPVGSDGVVRRDDLAALLAQAKGSRGLLTLQMANNETGVLQPVAEVARDAKALGLAVHTDAVQAAGRIAIDMRRARRRLPDAVRATSWAGPRASARSSLAGARCCQPLISGGGQERRRRAGTENVAAIAGFGAAAEAARRDLAQMQHVQALRDQLEAQVRAITPEAVVIARERCPPPQHDQPGPARRQRRDAGDRARSGGHCRERGRRVLLGQGRDQSRAGGDGARPARRARRHPHQFGPCVD